MGFIAQDVESVLPEIVHTDQAGFKYVAYGKVVPLLVEGVKELWSKVDFLEQTGRDSRGGDALKGYDDAYSSSSSGSYSSTGLFRRRGDEDVVDALVRMGELEQENAQLRQQVKLQEDRLRAIEQRLGLI